MLQIKARKTGVESGLNSIGDSFSCGNSFFFSSGVFSNEFDCSGEDGSTGRGGGGGCDSDTTD